MRFGRNYFTEVVDIGVEGYQSSIGSALDNYDCSKKYIDICHSEVSIEGQWNEWRAL